MSRAGFLQTRCLEVHQTRESCFSQSEGPLDAFFVQITSMFSCDFTEERIEFGHTSSDACPSVGFSYLQI